MPLVPALRPRAPRPLAAGLASVLAVGLVAAGTPAAVAAPIVVDYPTVFISQVVAASDPEHVAGTNTTLRTAVQSRLANAGAGGVEIRSLGSAATYQYNGLGYREADDYLYGMVYNGGSIGQLMRVEAGGATTLLGAVTGLPSSAFAAGSFGGAATADTYYVKTVSGSTLYAIDVTTRTVTGTITASSSFATWDFTWAHGYLWGVEIASSQKQLVRLDPSTGTVTRTNVTAAFPAGDTGGYGAAWQYGNGNLAFSNNDTGNITQIRVDAPTTATPTVTRVSSISGPPTAANDGATSPSSAADLRLTVTQPAPAAPSSPISWSVEVANEGPGGSSGGTFSFQVPTGVTAVTLPSGCAEAAGRVQCVSGPMAADGSDTYDFSATSPASPAVSSSSTVTVVGNEQDPGDDTATLVVTPSPQALTTSGVATAVQTVATSVPSGGWVSLLDAEGDPTGSVLVAAQGTYAVSGTSLTFTPVLGFTGTARAVDFVLTSGAETGAGTYTATVTPPSGPVTGDHTSTGAGATPQQVTVVAAPTGGSLTLLDAEGDPVTTVTVPDQGTYVLDADEATVTFTPVLGFTGTADPVPHRVTDAYGQSASGTYTPTVTLPAAPALAPSTSSGVGTTPQSPAVPVTVPTGGSVTLVADGSGTSSVVLDGQGTASVAPDGTLRFVAVHGFAGEADAVTVRVTDAYGQTATSTYTATVLLPAAPVAPGGTSSGIGTAEQGLVVTVPTGGAVTLLDAEGDPATTVVVPGEGTYVLDGSTITFTPVLGFDGEATPVTYRVTDAYGQDAEGSYTPTVLTPTAPAAAERTTTSVGTTTAQVTVVLPVGGSVTLLDADGDPVTTVTVPGEGTYTLVGSEITFTPVLGFHGEATPVTYRVTDAYGQDAEAEYVPTVLAPAGPAAAPGATTDVGTRAQHHAVTVPESGSVTLVGPGGPATTVVVPGQGTYVLDPATGEVVFTPVLGFHGEATGVTVRVTDAYGQTADALYVPTVTLPAPPVASELDSTGPAGEPQGPSTVLVIPDGGSVSLLDADGNHVTVVSVPGQGTYTLDPTTGEITFVPVDGFSGTADPVRYVLVDAYGQESESTYGAWVEAAPVTDDGEAEPRPPLAATGLETLPLLAVAAGLLLAGALLVTARRRVHES